MAKKPKKEVVPVFASEETLKEVKRDIKELEIMLKEDSARARPMIQDPASIKAEILKKQQYVLRHSPTGLRGDNANKAYKEAKELERIIKANMPGKKTYYKRYPKNEDDHSKHTDFENAVKQQIKFQTDPKVKHAIARYKYLMGRLDPQNPTVRNIERLRGR